jgi:hypothetical protein
MRRWLVVGLMTASLGSAATSALAANGEEKQKVHDWWYRSKVDWHRNNAWPEPFATADRAAQRAPFCMMVDNGWKMQNTVGTFLFDGNSQQLNTAGEHLVRWIVQQAPQHRRAVFVLKGDSPEATQTRIASVQTAVARYACEGENPPVILTMTEPPGWPASYVDQMTQQFQATIPAPRLPAAVDAGESGGDSGGGSGGSN